MIEITRRAGTLRRMWKDSGSQNTGCPALYDAGPDFYAVQGFKMHPDDRAGLVQLAGDEDAVLVPRNVIDRIRAEG